jgi:hypothetical protein
MNNVVRLFAHAEMVPSEAEARILIAVRSCLDSRARLVRVGNELSKRLEELENTVDTIDDTVTRKRLRQSIQLGQETLSQTLPELSQQIDKLVNCFGA